MNTPRDAELIANRKKCPDGQLRCLDCDHPEDDYCHGRNFGCGADDPYRIVISKLQADLAEAVAVVREVNQCGNGGARLSRAASDKVRAFLAKHPSAISGE